MKAEEGTRKKKVCSILSWFRCLYGVDKYEYRDFTSPNTPFSPAPTNITTMSQRPLSSPQYSITKHPVLVLMFMELKSMNIETLLYLQYGSLLHQVASPPRHNALYPLAPLITPSQCILAIVVETLITLASSFHAAATSTAWRIDARHKLKCSESYLAVVIVFRPLIWSSGWDSPLMMWMMT